MQIKIVEDKCNGALRLGQVPFCQLVKLLEPMSDAPAGTLGYTIGTNKFVVVAGHPLGVIHAHTCAHVEISKSGTLVLEIT